MSDILRLVAEMQWGGVLDEQLVEWTIKVLSSGQESPSLVLLAGLTKAEYQNASELFRRVLDELGYVIPDHPTLALFYARCIAQDIVEGTIDPDMGGDQLADLYYLCQEEFESCDWAGFRELHHLWSLRIDGFYVDVVEVAESFLSIYLKTALVFILRAILDAKQQMT